MNYLDLVTDSQLYLPLQETSGTVASDASGHGRNGTLTYIDFTSDSVAGPRSWLPRALRKTAANLNAIVAVPDHPDLRGGQNWTVACWVTEEQTTVFPITKGTDSDNKDWMLARKVSSNADPLSVIIEKENFGNSAFASSALHTGNSWVHLVGTFEQSTGRLILYVNGQQADSNIYLGESDGSTAPVTLFRLDYQGETSYEGSIAGVGMWNRVLTDLEIRILYLGPSYPIGDIRGMSCVGGAEVGQIDSCGGVEAGHVNSI